MAGDSFVVGLDLTTGTEAYIEDAPVRQWRAKSYKRGDESLVCLHCFRGVDAAAGTRVPLVVRSREGGPRRAHFAHPPYMAPNGGHSAETLWHAEGKHVFAHWARTKPGVLSAEPERYIGTRERRADVEVRMTSGASVVFELQYRLLHDDDWVNRHLDYASEGIVDVWLWHPSCRTPWIVARHGQAPWFFDLAQRTLGTISGQPHQRSGGWFAEGDLRTYAEHWPPCSGDSDRYYSWSLDELGLDPSGLVPPAALLAKLRAANTEIVSLADQARIEAEERLEQRKLQQRRPTSASAFTVSEPQAAPQQRSPEKERYTRPQSEPRKPIPLCDLCGIPLDKIWWDWGRHLDCDQQLQLRQRRA